LDVNKEEQFSVINPNNITVGHSSISTSFDRENINDTINPDNTQNRKNNFPSPTTESEEKDVDKGTYEARFEKIFGKRTNITPSKNSSSSLARFTRMGLSFDLETIFAKGREDFLKESVDAKINLIDQSNDIKSYSPGHAVKGDVVIRPLHIDEEEIPNKVRGLKITLSGIEHAFAQGLQRLSTIEKYDKNIELNGNEIGGKNDNNAIPFELVIPQGVSQSYIGKYSEYFWGLEAKVNIAWSSDLIAKTIIEIV
jgi:hypothetical protein